MLGAGQAEFAELRTRSGRGQGYNQLETLSSTTNLVTITIGGNDAGFS
jgi:lysophospholipase L1-like esterase